MADNPKKRPGRLALRIPSEFHMRLAVVAEDLGVDVTTLINMMLREAFPAFLERANVIKTEYQKANRKAAADALRSAAEMLSEIAPSMNAADAKSAGALRNGLEKLIEQVEKRNKNPN